MRASLSVGQFEVHPYPSNLRSGWLPAPDSPAWQQFYDELAATPSTPWAQSIVAMNAFIGGNPMVEQFITDACRQNENVVIADPKGNPGDNVSVPRIASKEDLLDGFNKIMTIAPKFYSSDLVGLPFSAWVVGIDPTLAGSTLFGLPDFNERMAAILNEWHIFLGTLASASGFMVDGEGWLSDAAKTQYKFDDWKKDQEILPYWTSWNSFFTREFKDPCKQRPVADPHSNRTVICPNDGSLFRWDLRVKKTDVFWFKDMNYSLSDMLRSPDPAQQEVIDHYRLPDMFEGGYVLQTYLNPYNFHQWWVPVNGEVLFEPLVVSGCFFKKLVLPDFGGATTASLPYLTHVNARGIIVFKTPDYGHVCCIPLGMSETSTISFDGAMQGGAQVGKGQRMGTFNYGGSSFVVIYENLPDKELFFVDEEGMPYPQRPVLPTSSSGVGGIINNIGSQLGVWYSK